MLKVLFLLAAVAAIIVFISLSDFSDMFIDESTMRLLYNVDDVETDMTEDAYKNDECSSSEAQTMDQSSNDIISDSMESDPGFIDASVDNENSYIDVNELDKVSTSNTSYSGISDQLTSLREQLAGIESENNNNRDLDLDSIQSDFVEDIYKEWSNGDTD